MGTFSTIKQEQNRVIAGAVHNVVNAIKADHEAAQAQFTATSSLHEGLLADIQIRQFDLIADEPKSLGGTDQGPNPVELVLGAFASCQEIVIAAYAAVLGIEVQRVNVKATGDLDLRGFFNVCDKIRPGFNKVTYETEIITRETDEAKLAQLRFFAQNRCPVLDILQHPVETEGNVTFKDKVELAAYVSE
ncbi:MAG: OsmC family protein [Bacteroidetes bacterium]|nr:OsmC family protein [Bacteroidota bacterium]MCH8524785.1 OsmC family protein [Balneolales bacterium]